MHTNATLDTGSDTTIIRKDIADNLYLHGTEKALNITSTAPHTERVLSKIVCFQIFSQNEERKGFTIKKPSLFINLKIHN